MAKDVIPGLMEDNMMENGSMVNSMEKANSCQEMDNI